MRLIFGMIIGRFTDNRWRLYRRCGGGPSDPAVSFDE